MRWVKSSCYANTFSHENNAVTRYHEVIFDFITGLSNLPTLSKVAEATENTEDLEECVIRTL